MPPLRLKIQTQEPTGDILCSNCNNEHEGIHRDRIELESTFTIPSLDNTVALRRNWWPYHIDDSPWRKWRRRWMRTKGAKDFVSALTHRVKLPMNKFTKEANSLWLASLSNWNLELCRARNVRKCSFTSGSHRWNRKSSQLPYRMD